jgi:hypothetical protein
MSISNFLEEAVLNKVFRNVNFTVTTVTLSLHTGDPGEDGTANEVAGGSYARQPVTFSAAANPAGTIASSIDVNFTGMPAATITHGGLWDNLGNFLWGGPLTTPKTTNAGDTFQVPSTTVIATLV